MRKIMVLSFFLISTFILSMVNAGTVDKKLHQNCLYPTIYIGRESGGYGSGVIVRSDKVKDDLYRNVFITCAHLINENRHDYIVKQYIYENWSQVKRVKKYPASFIGFDRKMDVAIGIFTSTESMPTAELDFKPNLFIGNRVFRIGCGLQGYPRLDYGNLTSYKKNPKPTFRTSVMTVPGDSGSPLFHEYKVVGIVVEIQGYHGLPVFSISYAVPLERFKRWDAENDHALDFAWDKSKPLPELEFRYLQFRDWKIK